MVSKTNELALEKAIEKYLAGFSTEELNERAQPANDKFRIGAPSDFDAGFALDAKMFWAFLETTQSAELDKLRKLSPNDWQRKILERFDRTIRQKGILHVLKKGIQVDNAFLAMMYPAPLASSSAKVHENFDANIFSVTRQVRYSQANPLQEIDMVLFLNGLPLVTLELKNSWTGQTAKYHGQKQYREDRDASQPLLQFGRALVHMAVDTNEVYMATKLVGASTFFLPFNKGHNEGAGNPPNPNGFKTSYLWEEVFEKRSLAGIIQHFMLLEGDSKAPLASKTMIFPRYHQLDVVRRLVNDVVTNGVGKSYLVQHSAGSGKSNSITWSAFQLIEAYPSSDEAARGRDADLPMFDSVIVVTDRRLLDKQLRDNIKDFSEIKNIVAPAFRSADLKEALEAGKKIIITTIQKFPFILDGMADMQNKRFAVIIDEAHSSQGGMTSGKMNEVLGAQAESEDDLDPQDKIHAAMEGRKMRGNASYLAFTATPKNTTLEKFGVKMADGSFSPFHLYSMKQAIEERFILDVLANYTTYKSYYEIQKSIEDNPEFDTRKAQKKLRSYVENSQQTINTKAEIMLEHFIDSVVNAKKLKSQARGMIVTQSIEMAIRYYKAVSKQLDARGNPFKALIAFSGEKEVDGIKYTEAEINGFAESETREYFDGFDKDGKPKKISGKSVENSYRLLIVANKYLTGFDQPKLSAMYVDKKLQGVLAVQALSRLNRSANKLGKKTEDLFVLDFFNTTEEIKAAFDPFFTITSLSEATDINILHELKAHLDDVGVYEQHEVDEFNNLYFTNAEMEHLKPLIDTAAARFNVHLGLEDSDKKDFKIKAKHFAKVYGQMASIIPFDVIDWEKLFWFLKFLIPELHIYDPDQPALDDLLDSVDLSTYGLERVKLNASIMLADDETQLDPQNPNPRSVHEDEVQSDELDTIIQSFNERWFQGWSATPEEQRVKFVDIADSIKAHPDYEKKYENNPDQHNRELAFEKILADVMLDSRKKELELYQVFAADPAFKAAWKKSLERYLDK